MNKGLLDKLKLMVRSRDDEMLELLRVLFWGNNPNYKDYLYLVEAESTHWNEKQFEEVKDIQLKKYICQVEENQKDKDPQHLEE